MNMRRSKDLELKKKKINARLKRKGGFVKNDMITYINSLYEDIGNPCVVSYN